MSTRTVKAVYALKNKIFRQPNHPKFSLKKLIHRSVSEMIDNGLGKDLARLTHLTDENYFC